VSAVTSTGHPVPAWTAWAAGGALVLSGSAPALLAIAAMQVLYPNVAGARWLIPLIAWPAGAAGAGLVVAGVVILRNVGRPAVAQRWIRRGCVIAAVAALPGVGLAVRWAVLTARDIDPFAGVWDLVWPVVLLFAPLVGRVVAGAMLPLRRGAGRDAATPSPAPGRAWAWRAATAIGCLAAGWWLVAPVGSDPVAPPAPAFYVSPGSTSIDAALAELALEGTDGARRYRRHFAGIQRAFWSCYLLAPEAQQEFLAPRRPAPWDAVITLIREGDPGAVAEPVFAALADPAFDVDARVAGLEALSDRKAWHPLAAPLCLETLERPLVERPGIWMNEPTVASARLQLLTDYRVELRRAAAETLMRLTIPPEQIELEVRRIYADPAVEADTGLSADALLEQMREGGG